MHIHPKFLQPMTQLRDLMPEQGVRSNYTQSPFQILMFDENGLISTGTAFFYELSGENFLITNWHNISGKNSLTKENLSGRFPTYIKAKFSTYIDEQCNHFTSKSHRIDIYKDYQPIWFEHPTLDSTCDVIAIPLEKPNFIPTSMHAPSNLVSRIRIPVKPGNPCFVIGFPSSLSIGFGLPLWKAGYIASEPHYDIQINGQIAEFGGMSGGTTLPAFFIDTLTREGMSGSPVFASYTGNWDMTDPYKPVDPDEPNFHSRNDIALGENRMEFVGCYSGRVGKKEDGAAVGLCWKESAIKLIGSSKITGRHPHILKK